ncbi:hypothetical protein BaRGS_00029989 [Batillaria attramentaria]|uniref:Uncharacterized protein n=1 Tax=Batillaria attramentaria TaxID=370345 RepID=A0ABD0JV95_9CAEN
MIRPKQLSYHEVGIQVDGRADSCVCASSNFVPACQDGDVIKPLTRAPNSSRWERRIYFLTACKHVGSHRGRFEDTGCKWVSASVTRGQHCAVSSILSA